MMTHKTAPLTTIAVRILRPSVGASSRLSQPSQSESLGCASRNVALMELFPRTFDNRDGGRSHTDKIDIWIFDFHAYRKALCDAHPDPLALPIRHTCRPQ